MGGTVTRLAAQGHRVHLLDMTNGEPTPLGTPERRAREWAAATALLDAGTGRVTRELLGLPNRAVQHTLEARHAVAGVIRRHRAQVIFAPHPEDAHPDHRATTRIVEDARFDAKLTKTDIPGEPIYPKWLIHYYCTHLRHVASPSFCLDISEQMELKLSAIRAYESQFVEPERNRGIVDWLRAMNAYMGSRVGCAYAEPFSTPEPLGLLGIDQWVM
jgi:LmbE family N-acetylglucosaminyl deacetylase